MASSPQKTEHLMLYLTPIFMIEFVWELLGKPRPLWVRLAQLLYALGGLAVVLSPGLDTALALLPLLELYSGVSGLVALGMLAWWRYKGDRTAGVVAIGMLTLTMAMMHDAFVDRGLMLGQRFAAYGFFGLVIGVSMLLGLRFHRAVEGLADLSRELEGRVKERTNELANAYGRMEELALRDSLTGLLNRRAIEERASSGLALATRRKLPYSVAIIDIDHFKQINDAHGHASGDRVLVAVSQALASAARASDDVARWGGEEFVVLLPDADAAASRLACERLRAAVEYARVTTIDAKPINVTVSVGVATADVSAGDAASFEELVRRADEGLYNAKNAGRNRVMAA